MKRLVQRTARAVVAVLGVAGLAAFPGGDGLAQLPTFTPGKGDDMRAVYAGAPDIAEGKAVADSACARCHGTNGISKTPGIPHIAGQRPAYLYLEMVAYRSGQRTNEAMATAVRFLSDEGLVKVAAYYASLEPAQPAPVRNGKPAKPDPMRAAAKAAEGCAGCHGANGVSTISGMPNLVGMDPKYMVPAMLAYKSGDRKHDMMKAALAPFDGAGLEALALHYALQKPVGARTPASGNKAAGKSAAASCAGCHGEQGVSPTTATPSLAGQDAQYFVVAMSAYKTGVRGDATMKGLVGGLDERTIRDLAAYYASLPPQAPKVKPPLTMAQWVQRCDRCHGLNGNSSDPRSPALAAQRVDYLEQVLRAYQSGARKSTAMAAMSDALKEHDIVALAAHYARQRAKSVVYVTLPPK